MDIYMKSLTVNPKGDADEITKSFTKVSKWLSEQSAYTDEYSFKYIETFIKSVLFLHENYIIHGDEIIEKLTNNEPFYKTFFETHILRLSDLNQISSLSHSILNSTDFISNVILLDNIFNNLKALYPTLEIIKKVGNSEGNFHNINGVKRKKMFMIINRLFRMPSSQFNMVLERICNSISFDIFGLIFTEDCSSTIFDKCTLLIHILCCALAERSKTQISSNFIRSIIACVMSSNEGKIFYGNCLKNERFSEGICQYFSNFLHNLIEFNYTLATYNGVPLMELFYLFYVSLEIMPNQLIATCSGIDLSNFLTKLFILFE